MPARHRPSVEYFEKFEDALASCKSLKTSCSPANLQKNRIQTCTILRGSCALVVGSEGGFSPEEFERAQAMGFAGRHAGRRILRAETAAIVLCGAVMFSLGEWDT